jgi:hypothetical protein
VAMGLKRRWGVAPASLPGARQWLCGDGGAARDGVATEAERIEGEERWRLLPPSPRG